MSRQCDYCDALEKDLDRLTKERDELRSLCEELVGFAWGCVELLDLDSGDCDEPECEACTLLGAGTAALARYKEWKEKNP